MLKRTLFCLILVSSLFGASKSDAQHHESGNILFDAYYGWPNLFTATLRTTYESTGGDYENVKIKTLGPIGARLEYLVSPRIGLGIHFNYAGSSVEATTQSFDANNDLQTYDYKASFPRMRIMPTLSIHMGSSSEFDPYFAFSVGYGTAKAKYETNDPDLQNVEAVDMKLTPVAWRLELGARYFFTDNLGINAAFGISGGALLTGGLSVKL